MSYARQKKEKVSKNTFWGPSPKTFDLNPIYFYLSEHVTTPVYSAPFKMDRRFYQSIFDGSQTVRNQPRIFETEPQSVINP